MRERAVALRADGLTYDQVAEQLRAEFESEARITKNAVAALIRRQTAEPRRARSEPKGLSPRTVRYVHTILHAALKDALRWNLVARNVADAATPPSAAAVRSHRPKAWTAEQLRAFLDYTSDSQYLPAWIFLATSGCRRGECLGLRWSDVDLDEATAIIARQVTAIDHRVIVKELPKTKQAHLIRLDSGTVSMLRKLRAEQAEMKLRLGAGYHDEGYVFCQPDGRPYHPERFSREFDRNQRYFNRDHPDRPDPDDHPPRPPPHLGHPRPERRHRHQDRQRAPQPQQHPHHERDLHPRHPADAERRGGTGRGVIRAPHRRWASHHRGIETW